MLTFILILIMIIGHWLGDFTFQSPNLVANKHKNFSQQCTHALVYGSVWLVIGILLFVFGLPGLNLISIFLFFGITVLTHLLVDETVSKFGYKYLYNDNPNDFLGVMHIDQLLHYLQLYLTFKLLF